MIIIHFADTAEIANDLGITQAELLARWRDHEKNQRAEERRYRNLQAVARRRGFELRHHAGYLPDVIEEDVDPYELHSLEWGGDPLTFETLNEVKADLDAHPVVKTAA
jgi:hypothetical protein